MPDESPEEITERVSRLFNRSGITADPQAGVEEDAGLTLEELFQTCAVNPERTGALYRKLKEVCLEAIEAPEFSVPGDFWLALGAVLTNASYVLLKLHYGEGPAADDQIDAAFAGAEKAGRGAFYAFSRLPRDQRILAHVVGFTRAATSLAAAAKKDLGGHGHG